MAVGSFLFFTISFLLKYFNSWDRNIWNLDSILKIKCHTANKIIPLSTLDSLRPVILVLTMIGEFYAQGILYLSDLMHFMTVLMFLEIVRNFLKSVKRVPAEQVKHF